MLCFNKHVQTFIALLCSLSHISLIKDKAGKISSKDNYRPIALADVFSKIIEVIILGRIDIFLNTNLNQFGFKKKHGIQLDQRQCIYVLKEIIDLYRTQAGRMAVYLYVFLMPVKPATE